MEGMGLAASIYDPTGAIFIRGSQIDVGTTLKNRSRERRVTRTSTLDGGVSVYDTGCSVADREVTIKVPVASLALAAFFAYMVETYDTIIVTTNEGAYEGTPLRGYLDEYGTAFLIIGINNDITQEA